MSDEPIDGRATIALVYKLVGELRAEMNDQMGCFDKKLEARFDALLEAIESLRGGMVSEPLCRAMRAETDATIVSAIHASEDDRERLWQALHAIEKQIQWAAAAIITAAIGLVVYLTQQHILP